MPSKDEPVRLQVPVPAHVAEELAERAQGLERSVAWLSDNLLDFMVEDRQRLADWYAMMLVGKTYGAAKRALTGKQRKQSTPNEEVRLQISISPKLLQRIEKLAIDARENSAVRMAGKLLEAGLVHHEPFLDFLQSKMGRATRDYLKRRGGSSGSKSEKLMPCLA